MAETVPAPKRRRVLDPSEVVPVPVYSSQVSSSLDLKPTVFSRGDPGVQDGDEDSLWWDVSSRLKTASTYISDSEDSDLELIGGRRRTEDAARCPSPPPPESPVLIQSRRVARKISEVNKKLRAVSSVLSPEPEPRRTRRPGRRASQTSQVSQMSRRSSSSLDIVDIVDVEDVEDVEDVSSFQDPSRQIPLKIRCRTDVHKIPVVPSTRLSDVLRQLSIILDVPPPRLLLLKGDEELVATATVLEAGLGIADIIECVVMAADQSSITVRLQGKDRASTQQFSISRDAPLSSVFSRYLATTSLSSANFLFDGAKVSGSETPAQLDMEDGDIVEVWT
ncbi:NFATC2-interacting protein [Cololabis saira]|uniref:NFATC2-interacting protein n=1 Tax=Cololabis saira TaxID=129043 RepID=UPI002AD49CCD|nr:NFATC2-interacting protein [Cololabis saira]